jgi:FUN14 domain-containing protein 1
MADEAKSIVKKIFGDVDKASATKQIAIGAVTGWTTGYVSMKVGKTVAIALGGSILLLQVANQQGYINIDWNKINKKVDKVTDKIEETITGQGQSTMDKITNTLNRNADRVEDALRKKSKKVKSWYSNLIGDENGPHINELHIFMLSFAAGLALGLGSA